MFYPVVLDLVIQKVGTEGNQHPSWLWMSELYINSACINVFNDLQKKYTTDYSQVSIKYWGLCVSMTLMTEVLQGGEAHLAYRHIRTYIIMTGFHIS